MKTGPIDLEKITKETDNIYEAAVVAAKKARQINDADKIEFNTILNSMPSTGLEDEIDEKENPDQMRLSVEFESRPKPHMRALEQLFNGEIKFHYKDDQQQ